MKKDEFIKLLNNAKEDEYGNLYYEEKILESDDYTHRVYFSTITTICENLMNLVSDPTEHEVYDRHFWNDDTLEAKIVYIDGDI